MQSVPTLLYLSNHWSYFCPCSFAFSQMSHKQYYVAMAFCVATSYYGRKSLNSGAFLLSIFSLKHFLINQVIYFRVSHSLDFADCIPQGVACEKPQKSSCCCELYLGTKTLDRRSRKARNQGCWHRFYSALSFECRQVESELEFFPHLTFYREFLGSAKRK